MSERKKRSQNTPKKGSKNNTRPLCEECLKEGIEIQMKKTSTQYTLDKKIKTTNAGLICIRCKKHIPNVKELDKIPK